jgi:hypothetical protein
MSTDDPGDPDESRSPHLRREYRRDSETDDAWAAADQDQLDGHGADIEDLAAGYLWEDDERYGVRQSTTQGPSALGPLPSPARRGRARRDQRPRGAADPAGRLGGRETYPGQPRRGPYPAGGPAHHIPYWQVLIIVILGMLALLVTALACAAILTLL